MLLRLIVLILCGTSWWQSGTARQLPSYLKVCKANDPNISACWKKTFESLRPYMTKDLPEINLPRIDPLKLAEVNLIQDTATRNLYINASLYDVEFAGGQNFQLLDNQIELVPDYFTQLHLLFPKFTLKSKYRARGRILLFDFEGDGDATGEFTDVEFNGTWTGTPYTKKGKKFVTIKPNGVDVKVKGISIHLDNLLRGNPEISENINQSINENIDLLYQDFLPVLRKTLETVVTEYSNRFLGTFPIDVLYPKN